jgi:hypothetical protein
MGRGRWLAAACVVALFFAASATAHRSSPRSHWFVWPATGTITTPFGPTDMGFHPGIDIGMLRSLDIRAAASGVVTATGYTTGFEGYGNIVLVNVGGGLQTLYAHLSRVRSHIGEHVVPGELLGIAGCTGSCTGTHLHFEVRLGGTAVDPMRFLPGIIPAAPSGPAVARRQEVARAVRVLFAHVPGPRIPRWLAPHRTRTVRSQSRARHLAGVAPRTFP